MGAFCLLAAGLLVASSCGKKPSEERSPVFVLGLDALDWQVIDPLMEEGLLPNFAGLMAESVSGDLMTLIPFAQSPAIWTTIGAGKYPEVHGISGFLKADETGKPITGYDRRVKAVWNILGSAGWNVGIVGWLATWPCEAVNGFMVSDYLQYNYMDIEQMSGQTYPASLLDRISPMVAGRRDVPLDSLRKFIDLGPDESELDNSAVREGLDALRWIYAADKTFVNVGLDLWREYRPDFFTVYLRGPDAVCHSFWGYRGEKGRTASVMSVFAPTVDLYYQYMDEVLGLFLAEIDPSVSLLVLSDHGFRGAITLDDGTIIHGVGAHRELGIIIARGPHFRREGIIEGAVVEDITPTILYLAGMPLAHDMVGEPIWDMFTDEFRAAHPPRFIDTYETGDARAQPEPEGGSPVDEELIERLRSLGYID